MTVEPFQLAMRDDPFWMLVGCVLANRTRWSQAKPVHAEIRRRWPTPEALAGAPIGTVVGLLTPLGFRDRRGINLVNMAAAWAVGKRDLRDLPGCGKYAADSYAIFVEGRIDVEPTDRVLKAYLEEKKHDRIRRFIDRKLEGVVVTTRAWPT